MNSDDLGLSSTDLGKVLSHTNVVIHSAASIGLEADVQHSLRSNYIGTRRLLALAVRMQNLRCFLHVSTAYVNVNFPKGSSVDEIIYPLMIGRQEANHADIVDDLMSLDPASANVRVSTRSPCLPYTTRLAAKTMMYERSVKSVALPNCNNLHPAPKLAAG